jgi:phospholipase D-like protein
MLIASLNSSAPPLWTGLAPLVAVVPALYCMVDVSRHPHTRTLSAPVWLAICAFGNVFGLLAYLRFGRSDDA